MKRSGSNSQDQQSINQKSEQDKQSLQQKNNECPLCEQSSFEILINNALYHKYLDTQYINYIRHINNIMDDQICPQTIKYKEMMVVDQDEEFMRRMYNLSEYDYKNKAIVEYYKFHKDYPKVHIKGISRLMQSFYDKKKQFEYKKIKRILKNEQNISITTQKSSSIFSDIEQEQKKSHYSNVLNDITQNGSMFNEQTNESQVLKNMCKKIDRAFQNQRLSPLNFRKKSIFDNIQNKEANDTKNFINYLKKQQDRKQKQQKYKNFIRSNKQSRYNSIEHDSKQYASGITSQGNLASILAKKSKQGQNHKSPFFYDGKMFHSNSTKGNLIGHSKDQNTKEQTNAPSQDNYDFQYYHAENGFKKNKDHIEQRSRDSDNKFNDKRLLTNNLQMGGYKLKNKQKTTEQIYTRATQDLKIKRRSISYNSLANTNASSKRSSIIQTHALKQKDFQIKNRSSSQTKKLFKDKNTLIGDQFNIKRNMQNQNRIERVRSSSNFKTTRSLQKFQKPESLMPSQINLNQNSQKKISIPKDLVNRLKGKSYSVSKLKNDQNNKLSSNSHEKSGPENERQLMIQKRKQGLNLFIQNNLKNQENMRNFIYSHHSSNNNVNIDNLLNKKLLTKVQSNKVRQHKILI